MTMLGDEDELRKLYQNDAKLIIQDVRNEGKKLKEQGENDRYR